MSSRKVNKKERGAALVELAVGATIFLVVLFGVLEFGRLLWIHNALVDATRRGARYAVNHDVTKASVQDDIRRMAVYGNTDGTGTPLVNGLTAGKVMVSHSGYELSGGTVTVEIENYDFQFVLPFLGTTIRMPTYHTTLTAENAGYVPASI